MNIACQRRSYRYRTVPALDVHLRYAGWSYQDLGRRSACRTTGDGQVLVFPAFRCRIRVVEGRAAMLHKPIS